MTRLLALEAESKDIARLDEHSVFEHKEFVNSSVELAEKDNRFSFVDSAFDKVLMLL